MNTKIAIVYITVSLIIGQVLLAEERPFFLQRDKQLHIAGSALFSYAVTGFARSKGSSKLEAFFYGAGASIALGLLKEGLDGIDKDSTREWADVWANVIGASAGALISAQFEWKF